VTAPAKAYLQTEKGTKIPCMFNPAELSLSKSNSWDGQTQRGKNAPQLLFKGGSSGSLSISLMFDTTHEGKPVTDYTNTVTKLMDIDTSLKGSGAGNKGRPPWVQFHWGDFHSFKCVVTSLTLNFTYFSSEGTPLRAKVELTLEQFEPVNNWGPQNPTSGTPVPGEVHRVTKGETLDRISAAHYGDSTQWRIIAEANGITDPLALKPGSLLAIPRRRD
jgi:hypothetical protein